MPGNYVQPLAIREELGVQPKDHLICSIVTLLICNLICGGVAIFFSLRSRKSWQEKKYTNASKYSRWSRILNIMGIVVGAIMWIIIILIIVGTAFHHKTTTAAPATTTPVTSTIN